MNFKIFFIIFLSIFFIGCTNSKLPEICYKKGSTGICRGYFNKYYFNHSNNKCEKYIYGGCGEVVFHTIKECKQTCEE